MEMSSQTPPSPPFATFLQVIALTTTITVSVSISASQGFATGGNFLGVSLDEATGQAAKAVNKTKASATWFAWSAATSSLSLAITLVLQLLLTDVFFVRYMTDGGKSFQTGFPRVVVSVGSWIALVLQGIALALIGEALKSISHNSGAMIQVRRSGRLGDSVLTVRSSGLY